MLLPILLLAAEPQWNCENPGPQQEMNYCAHVEYEKADAALNAQWEKTAAWMKELDASALVIDDGRPGYFDALLEAQRTWLKFRDAHCRSEGYLFRGGSMEPLMVSTCKTHLTKQRTEQLRELAEVDG